MDKTAIRNAATVIVLRQDQGETRVLMGQRGAKAAFMPNKFVFPGGAVDAEDANIALHQGIDDLCTERLGEQGDPNLIHPLCVAAIRELWEETGLILGAPEEWQDAPKDWSGFAKAGFRPSAEKMYFFFRAITPPGPPRRFDARFFLVDADQLAGDLDDFSGASDELSHLQWVPLDEARALNLPFITSIVLGELAALREIRPPVSVPFFKNQDEESLFLRLNGSEQQYQ